MPKNPSPSHRRLDLVTARELMRSHVITIPDSAPVREAIETFEDEHVTGLPVVDATGKVIGMLSEHDVVRTEHVRRSRIEGQRGDYIFAEPLDELSDDPPAEQVEFTGRDDYSPAVLGEELVKDWMNPAVISVTLDTTLKAICELMRREGIHRVLVIEGGKLKGIVSAFDVIRYLARTL